MFGILPWKIILAISLWKIRDIPFKSGKVIVPYASVTHLIWKRDNFLSSIFVNLASSQCWTPTGQQARQYSDQVVQ